MKTELKKRALVTVTFCAVLLAIVYMTVGCATPYQAKELDTKSFEVKGSASNGKIGLNDKKQIVIKKETSAEDELRVQEMVNMHLQDDVKSDLFDLKLCRKDLADPRLGGDGKLSRLQAVDDMKSIPDEREEMGLDEDGNLKIVSEQFFEEKLKAERKFEKTLRKMGVVAKEHLEECEMKMTQIRLEHGLPGKRIMAEGYFLKDGTWVEQRKGEGDLTDAFELQAMAKAKAPKE